MDSDFMLGETEADRIMEVLDAYGVTNSEGRKALWKVLHQKSKGKFQRYRDAYLAKGKSADDANTQAAEQLVEELSGEDL